MKIEKVEKLVANKHDKVEYVRNLKQAWFNGLLLKKVHRIITYNKKASLKSYIDMNTNLSKKTNNFGKDFF